MPRISKRPADLRPSGGERVFTDPFGRLWSAGSHADRDGITVIFTCITDGRQSGRAIVVELPQEVGEFRRWSKDGKWAGYVGYPSQSSWIDMFAINMETGEARQLTLPIRLSFQLP